MRKKLIVLVFLLKFSLFVAQKTELNLNYDEIAQKYSEQKALNGKLKFANLYLIRAKNENNNLEIARAYYLYTISYYTEKDSDKIQSIKYLDQVIKYSFNENDDFFPFAAYYEKGKRLIELGKIEEAIRVYKEGEKISKERNNDYYYTIRYSIGLTKSEELGEIEEGLKTFYECEKALRDIRTKKYDYLTNYLNAVFAISDVYNSKKLNDSCIKYLNIGIIESTKYRDEINLKRFELLKSSYLINNNESKKAINLIYSIKPFIFKNLSDSALPTHYLLGKAFLNTNEKEKAIDNFKKVDSIYQITKSITPEFVDGYKVLIDYYREKKDDKNQIKYLNTFLEIEDKFKKRYRKFYSVIKEQYDVPNLFEEKNNIITKQNYIVYALLSMVFLLIIIVITNKIRERNKILKFKKVLEESLKWQKYPLLLDNGEVIELNESIIDVDYITENDTNEKSRTKDLNKEIIDDILFKLENFVEKKGFLNKSLTSTILAKEFQTNAKYLANVINDYKGMKVNDYINNLRIEYAILMLQKDKKLRKYNLEALAEEFGFNNLVSFNTSFLNKTDIKPAYFIKSLIEGEKNNN